MPLFKRASGGLTSNQIVLSDIKSGTWITIGSTAIDLGDTITALVGLTDLDLTSGNKTIFDGIGANTLTLGASTTTVAIAGNLQVLGTSTTISSNTLTIGDALYVLNTDSMSVPTHDAGFVVERGDSANVGLIWDESADEFVFINTAETGTTAGNVVISSYAALQSSSIKVPTILSPNNNLLIALAGSFPSPDPYVVHIWRGDAGDVVGDAATALVIEDSTQTGIQILTPTGSARFIMFGEPGDTGRGRLQYYGSTDTPADTWRFDIAGLEKLRYSAGAFQFQEATTISSTSGRIDISPAAGINITAGSGDLNLTGSNGATWEIDANGDLIMVSAGTNIGRLAGSHYPGKIFLATSVVFPSTGKIETTAGILTIDGASNVEINAISAQIYLNSATGVYVNPDGIAAANFNLGINGTATHWVFDSGDANLYQKGGQYIVGHTAPLTFGGNADHAIQIAGAGGATSQMAISRWSANSSGPEIAFAKSRSATKGSYSATQLNDALGGLKWFVDDGVDQTSYGAQIIAKADETATENQVGTRLEFHTAAIGNSSSSLWWTITNAGVFQGQGASTISTTAGNLTLNPTGDILFQQGANEVGRFEVAYGGYTDAFRVKGVTAAFSTEIHVDALSGYDSNVKFMEAATWKYSLGYDASANYMRLTSTDVDGAGTNGDIFRILDGQRSINFYGDLDFQQAATISTSTGILTLNGASGLYMGVTGELRLEATTYITLNQNSIDMDIAIGVNGDWNRWIFDGGDSKLYGDNGAGIVLGHPSQETFGGLMDGGSDAAPEFQVLGSGGADSSIVIHLSNSGADGRGPTLVLSRSNHSTIGTHGAVTDGQHLGRIASVGDDGTDYQTPSASILFRVDGTVSTGRVDSEIVFVTSNSGHKERWIIRSDGTLEGVGASTITNTTGALTLTSADAATWGTTSGNLTISAGGNIVVPDDKIFNLGTSGDIVEVLDATGRAANAAFAGVLVGTPVYAQAIPANSLIVSNITADGDIVFFTNTGGNSIEGMRLDASTGSLMLPPVNNAATPTLAIGQADQGFYRDATNSLAIAMRGAKTYLFNDTFMGHITGGNLVAETPSATNPTLIVARADSDTGLGEAAADQLSLIAGGKEGIRVIEAGSAITGINFYGDLDFQQASTIKTAAGNLILNPAGNVDLTTTATVQLLLPLSNDAVTPTLAFGDGDTGFYEKSDDTIGIAIAGSARWEITASLIQSGSAGGAYLKRGGAGATTPAHAFVNDSDTGIGLAAADQLSLIAGGVEGIRVIEAGSAISGINFYGDLDFQQESTIRSTGGLIFTASGDMHLNATANRMTFNIDTDNDTTNAVFQWWKNGGNGSGTKILELDESGSLIFQQASSLITATGDFLIDPAAKVVHVSAGGDEGSIVSVLDANTGTAQTGANTNVKTLYTYTMLANTFVNVGDSVRYHAAGTFASNGNTKTLTAHIGSSVLGTLASTANGAAWEVEVHAYMAGVGSQRIVTKITIRGVVTDIEFDIKSEDETGTIELKITGQNGTASASDIVKRIANTVFYPEHA